MIKGRFSNKKHKYCPKCGKLINYKLDLCYDCQYKKDKEQVRFVRK